jgi:hypothetical protein
MHAMEITTRRFLDVALLGTSILVSAFAFAGAIAGKEVLVGSFGGGITLCLRHVGLGIRIGGRYRANARLSKKAGEQLDCFARALKNDLARFVVRPGAARDLVGPLAIALKVEEARPGAGIVGRTPFLGHNQRTPGTLGSSLINLQFRSRW